MLPMHKTHQYQLQEQQNRYPKTAPSHCFPQQGRKAKHSRISSSEGEVNHHLQSITPCYWNQPLRRSLRKLVILSKCAQGTVRTVPNWTRGIQSTQNLLVTHRLVHHHLWHLCFCPSPPLAHPSSSLRSWKTFHSTKQRLTMDVNPEAVPHACGHYALLIPPELQSFASQIWTVLSVFLLLL